VTISARDKRTLLRFAPVAGLLAILVIYRWVPWGGPETRVVTPAQSVAAAEKRLARYRQLAATVDVREVSARRAAAALADREKGIIQAATAAQAQAQLLQVVRRIGKAQAPPIDLRSVELGQIQPFGSAYGLTSVSVTFACRIEQLVNLVADLTAQPELVAPADLRITSGDQKQKVMQVRLTVAGVVPRALVPEKKGGPAF
jgi:hypothetical protein